MRVIIRIFDGDGKKMGWMCVRLPVLLMRR